jgi:hypothetical protein
MSKIQKLEKNIKKIAFGDLLTREHWVMNYKEIHYQETHPQKQTRKRKNPQ